MFLVKDAIPTSESEIRGTSEFFLPPPLKKIPKFFITFLHLSGYFKTFKKQISRGISQNASKFFSPPLKRVENFLAPPFCQVAVLNK